MRYLMFLLAVSLLGGCAVVDSMKTKNYSPPKFVPWEEHLNSFVGKNISQAQKRFGHSYVSRGLEEGRKAFIWYKAEQRSELYGDSKLIYGRSNTFTCEWSFVTNDSNTILEYHWHGNDCPKTVNLN